MIPCAQSVLGWEELEPLAPRRRLAVMAVAAGPLNKRLSLPSWQHLARQRDRLRPLPPGSPLDFLDLVDPLHLSRSLVP